MSSFDERFSLKEELVFSILNSLKIAATKTVPTNIRGSLAYNRVLFLRAKDIDMNLELLKARRRKEIESSIAVATYKKEIELKLKQKEQIETKQKEIEEKLKQNEQSITELKLEQNKDSQLIPPCLIKPEPVPEKLLTEVAFSKKEQKRTDEKRKGESNFRLHQLRLLKDWNSTVCWMP